jgi:hypothetical protein
MNAQTFVEHPPDVGKAWSLVGASRVQLGVTEGGPLHRAVLRSSIRTYVTINIAEVRHAFLVMILRTRRNVVAVPEPEYVDGVSLVMHAEPRAKGIEMRLHGADTEAEAQPSFMMGTCTDIGTQDFQLAPLSAVVLDRCFGDRPSPTEYSLGES